MRQMSLPDKSSRRPLWPSQLRATGSILLYKTAQALQSSACICALPLIERKQPAKPTMSIQAGILGRIVDDIQQGIDTDAAAAAVLCAERRGRASKRSELGERSQQSEQGGGGGEKAPPAVEPKRSQDEALDDALAQTFPASDPVALWIAS